MVFDYLWLTLTLVAVGLASGFGAGLFGIGGGIIMVPALYYALSTHGVAQSVVMHCAIATSAAVIVVNAIRSVRSHTARGSVDWDLLWPKNPMGSYALWIGLGSFVAAIWIAPRLSGTILTGLFVVVACLVSLQFILGRPEWTLRSEMPGGLTRPVVGSSIGLLSALMGIGGGSLTVPFMAMCSVPIHRAIGTASGFGLAIAAPATLGFIISGWGVTGRPAFSLGYVNGLSFALIAAAAYISIPLGVKLAHNLSQRNLKRIFGICLLLVALNMGRQFVF